MNIQNFLWVTKYSPQTIDDCILSSDLKEIFKKIVSSGTMQNFLFCGSAGCGKTTVAKVLCESMNSDYIFINASENGNIDTLRTTIRNFASTVSLSGGIKVVILDEADALSAATQSALRGFIEEFAVNCRFIFTCNFKNKIIEPLHSRCTPVEFRFLAKEKSNIILSFLNRICFILDQENIKYDKKVLAEFIVEYFPDFRRVIGELQKYSIGGSIDSGILSRLSDDNFKKLISYMKDKNFTEVRKWISVNIDLDHYSILKKLYESLTSLIDKATIPAIVMILSEYQYKLAFAVDPEITLSACMAEIMVTGVFL